jgi:opine dehydrogenase
MSAGQSYVVLGAGNGGLAMAAELALLGRDVALFEHAAFEDKLRPIREAGGIEVDSRIDHFPGGQGVHFAPLSRLTTDSSVVAGADVVIVVVPGQHQETMIQAVLPRLRSGQLVLVNPGGVGGALVWGRALREAGVEDVLLAQPSDLLYAGSRTPDHRVRLGGKKKRAVLGVFPNTDRNAAFERLGDDFPEFEPAANVLEAGLGGPGMLVHPLPMLMNAVRIDREAPFRYDAYDITPSVARAIERLDAERIAVIAALGGRPTPAKDVLTEYYGVSGADFYDTVIKVPAYQGSTAPPDFTHRYITEEVPTHLVPAIAIAGLSGVATEVMEATVTLAGAVTGEDFRRSGWTAERLGLAGLDRDGVVALLETGRT